MRNVHKPAKVLLNIYKSLRTISAGLLRSPSSKTVRNFTTLWRRSWRWHCKRNVDT